MKTWQLTVIPNNEPARAQTFDAAPWHKVHQLRDAACNRFGLSMRDAPWLAFRDGRPVDPNLTLWGADVLDRMTLILYSGG